MQRVSPATFIDQLARDFGTTAGGVGFLVSGYFYGYVVLQIPAGILVDTFGVRRVILISLIISALGTLAFAISPYLAWSFVARLLVACGDALVFTAMIKYVAERFSDARFGLMSGLSQVSGYVGGILATTPLAVCVSVVGWRGCFVGISALVSALWLVAYIGLPEAGGSYRPTGETRNLVEIVPLLKRAFREVAASIRTREAWGCALTFAAHFAAITTLTAAWGIPMLMQAYGFSRVESSTPILAFMITNVIGSIAFGYLADYLRALPTALIASCVARIVLLLGLAQAVGHSFGLPYVIVDFAVLGLVYGSIVPLILKCLKVLYSSAHVATGVALNSTLAGLIGGCLQPIIGFVLDKTWGGAFDINGKVYSSLGYNLLVVLLIASSFLARIIHRAAIGRREAESGDTSFGGVGDAGLGV